MTPKPKKLGVSIRFIREYEPSTDSTMDQAFMLAMSDPRDEDTPFVVKLKDALTFLRQRIN